MNITSESFDYGPWRFLETLDPDCTAAYFDHSGLYAYGRQPDAVLWNLAQLATCFSNHASHEALEAILEGFAADYHAAFRACLLKRLGLASLDNQQDKALTRATWIFLSESQVPFEAFFFDWFSGIEAKEQAMQRQRAGFYQGEVFDDFLEALNTYTAHSDATRDHAYFQHEGPCTMTRPDVEALWEPIDQKNDWSAFEIKLAHITEMREALIS